MRKNLFVLTVLLLLLVGCSELEASTKEEDTTIDNIEKNASDLVIPDLETILKEGYPTNENGQTYGPNLKNLDVEPDLILVEGENGILGYIYQPKGISSPIENSNKNLEKSTPVYLQDGKTVIGTFSYN